MKYEVRHANRREAIFDTETGQQISKWWIRIYEDGLVKGQSEYYKAGVKVQKSKITDIYEIVEVALFHKDKRKPVSRRWKQIEAYHLLCGQSKYYLAQNQEGKWAIFHINNPDVPASKWWDRIIIKEPLEKMQYYTVTDGKQEAVFHIDNPDEPISQWWDGVRITVYPYLTLLQDKKWCISHISNPDQPMTDWHAWIDDYHTAHHVFVVKNLDETYSMYLAIDTTMQHILEHSKDSIHIVATSSRYIIYTTYQRHEKTETVYVYDVQTRHIAQIKVVEVDTIDTDRTRELLMLLNENHIENFIPICVVEGFKYPKVIFYNILYKYTQEYEYILHISQHYILALSRYQRKTELNTVTEYVLHAIVHKVNEDISYVFDNMNVDETISLIHYHKAILDLYLVPIALSSSYILYNIDTNKCEYQTSDQEQFRKYIQNILKEYQEYQEQQNQKRSNTDMLILYC